MIYANPKSMFKPRLNESLMDSAKKNFDEHNISSNNIINKHTPEGSILISNGSIDENDIMKIPKRPKSSQSFAAKQISSKIKPRPATKLKLHACNAPKVDITNHMIRSVVQNVNINSSTNKKSPVQAAKRPIRVTKRLPKELELVRKIVRERRQTTDGFINSKSEFEDKKIHGKDI